MVRSFPGDSVLFVEGLKMRPSAFLVIRSIHDLGAVPSVEQEGCSTKEIAAASGLSSHVVRARLQDLRRLGLVASDDCPVIAPRGASRSYGHYLTPEGLRRVRQG